MSILPLLSSTKGMVLDRTMTTLFLFILYQGRELLLLFLHLTERVLYIGQLPRLRPWVVRCLYRSLGGRYGTSESRWRVGKCRQGTPVGQIHPLYSSSFVTFSQQQVFVNKSWMTYVRCHIVVGSLCLWDFRDLDGLLPIAQSLHLFLSRGVIN